MSSNDDTKPAEAVREWWISGWKLIDDKDEPLVHVIEYRAYVQAIAERDSLRAEVERLKSALERIADDANKNNFTTWFTQIAREALKVNK